MSIAKPTVSVIIPLYNKIADVVRTIDSVLKQTVAAAEIIVVDDGSTDGGPNWLAQERGEHIRLIRQPNGGVSAARNRGIAEARCELLAFLDADDLWEPHYLEEMLAMVQRFPEADCFASAYQVLEGENSYRDPKIRFAKMPAEPQLLADYFDVGARGDLPFMTSSFCIRRAAVKVIGGFPEGEAMGEDQDFFARAALQLNIAYTPSVLLFYRVDSSNRACDRIIPDDECPFSQRLTQRVASSLENTEVGEAVLDYCGAHLLHIASLNIRIGRLAPAKRLLADARAKRHGLRHRWWSMRMALVALLQGRKPLPMAA